VSAPSDVSQPADALSLDAGFSGSRGLSLVRGEGVWVFDDAGRRYLDATSMYGVASLGHAHPALAEALATQAGRLVSCFASYENDRRTALFERLFARLAPLDRFFLCNSGTEAIEALLKLARAVTGRPGVVALAGAFHGRTFGALSATFRSKHRDAFQPLLTGFRHVRPGDTAALAEALSAGDVGLFLAEVVQGEGGVRPIDGAFLREAQELCRAHGVVFGVDEVQTGIGRTGRWFAFQHHDISPDAVCLAKGLAGGVPMGALAFRSSLGKLEAGQHGSTFGGNPLACAAACAVLDTVEAEGLCERAARLGEGLLARFREELAPGPDRPVREVRGRGLMLGLELAEASAPVQRRLQERGVLALGAGLRVLRLLPPLVIGEDEIDLLATSVIEELGS
jgi:acetylornithine/LysW-gamma-L-lysine aminotransferase